MAIISMRALLETGVHFGHRARRWNPKMRPYIFTERNNIHIIDLQQTIIALIINASEAMPGGGRITITTKSYYNSKVEITIEDTGEGIPKENLKKIFDPFFTTKDDAKSTGLGLFVAYGIIKEHKGTIRVESEPDQGTRFIITLPVVDMK